MAVMNLVIDDEKKDDLEELAKRKGLALSGLVRMVLYAYLTENETPTSSNRSVQE